MITKSDDIGELAAALALAQGEMGNAFIDARNPHFKSKYASITAVFQAGREALAKHGLAIIQPPSTGEGEFIVTTMLLHKSGQWISSEMQLLLGQRKDMQALGSAITYARRYCYASMLGITPDEDDDGNAASDITKKDEEAKGPPILTPPKKPDNFSVPLQTMMKAFGKRKFEAAKGMQLMEDLYGAKHVNQLTKPQIEAFTTILESLTDDEIFKKAADAKSARMHQPAAPQPSRLKTIISAQDKKDIL